LTSPQLQTTKKIYIYLPKDYKNSKKIFQLYMHDAQNLFDSKTSYAGEWNIDENWTVLMPS
jgi:alpha-glucosidase